MSADVSYIVLCAEFSSPLALQSRSTSLWKLVPAGGILLRGFREASSFSSRALAHAAIRRTKAYFVARDHNPKPFGGFEIYRVKGGAS